MFRRELLELLAGVFTLKFLSSKPTSSAVDYACDTAWRIDEGDPVITCCRDPDTGFYYMCDTVSDIYRIYRIARKWV
jgi:hypothetical protein